MAQLSCARLIQTSCLPKDKTGCSIYGVKTIFDGSPSITAEFSHQNHDDGSFLSISGRRLKHFFKRVKKET